MSEDCHWPEDRSPEPTPEAGGRPERCPERLLQVRCHLEKGHEGKHSATWTGLKFRGER